jgi:hypothetical protein
MDDRRRRQIRHRLIAYPVIALLVMAGVWLTRRPPVRQAAPVPLPTVMHAWWQPQDRLDEGTAYALTEADITGLYSLLGEGQEVVASAGYSNRRGIIWIQSVQARHAIIIYPADTPVYSLGSADYSDFPAARVHVLLDGIEARVLPGPLPPEAAPIIPQMEPMPTSDSPVGE